VLVDAGSRALRLDKPIDLGPAGALVAGARGVIERTRGDEIVATSLDGAGAHNRPPDSIEGGPRGPAPALSESSRAYWVARGKLVRRAYEWDAPARALEILADDAFDGTRVAAATAQGRDVAIYIARPKNAKDERTAKMWVEGAGVVPLSSEGSGASSVALASAGGRLLAITLDERSAMSPVHARTIDLDPAGAARLGPDTVVFVGPSPESHNEIAAAPGADGPHAFIPFARDTSSFGLASLFIAHEPKLDAPVQWTMYPNGLEPAPVDAATICGRTWVAYVRPSSASADAPRVLVLAPLESGGLGAETTAAQGFDFYGVSMAARRDGGAWLAWIGNGRSWARGLKC
jgi:hypothetical protein